MLEYNFAGSPGYWICMTAHQYERAMNAELEPRGITYRQSQVLAWLALKGPMAQNDLAEQMRIEPPTLVGILDRMEREGWISRESCSTDRRRKIVSVRPKARPVWKKIVACAQRVRRRATRGLSPTERRILKRLLTQVQDNLQADFVSGELAASRT